MTYPIILRFTIKINEITTSNITLFYGRFSDLSEFMTSFKFKMYNCCHPYYYKSMVL